MGATITLEAGDAALSGCQAGLSPGARQSPGTCLRLVLLGRIEAWGLASRPALPRSRKARALLAILGLAGGTPVPRQRLGNLLWSRSGEAQRRGSLRQALHELQNALGEAAPNILHSDRDAVVLRGEEVWVDALEVARATPDRPEALDLFEQGGELLADLDGVDPAFDQWLGEQRRRLRGQAAAAAGAMLAVASGPDARTAAAQRLLALDPADDAGWRALRGIGRTGEAEAEGGLRAEGRVRRGARLGVLPLRGLGEGVPAHLAYGLAEAVTEALARFRWLFVADCASLAAASQSTAVPEAPEIAARAMGLDFLLSGTLQQGAAPGHVRMAFRLTDLREDAGAVVWSQRFDREVSDLLALQDEVAAEVVARMDPEILLIEAGRAAARGGCAQDSASAYDLLLRAMPAIQGMERAAFLQAGRDLEKAALLDPDHGQIHAWHAYWHLFLVGQGWASDEDGAMAEAERLAARAVALDPMDALGLTILGQVRAFLHHRVAEALALHRRALSLNPNLAMAWVFLGMAESYAGAHESALRRLDRYSELAPCHPYAFFLDAARGIPLLMLGRHAEAVEVGRAVTALQPGLSYPYKTYLSALGHLGLAEEAAQVKARLLAIEPDFDLAKALRRTPLRRPADRALYARGLKRAGLA